MASWTLSNGPAGVLKFPLVKVRLMFLKIFSIRKGQAAFLTFPLVKARPTFLKKIFSFSKGQADVFEKKIVLGKVRPTF